jgi:anaerobic selenocysteine-containing dehydrogenase
MEIKRRDFLRLSLVAGATAALGGPTLNAFANGKDTKEGSGGTEPGQWIPSTCQGCTAWCPAEFFVQSGRAVKVRGNQLCKANNGYVCPRGHLMLQELYDPDRVKVPMKRTNPQKGRGIDPKFVPISWDEAMDIIAEKMMELEKQ